MSVLISFRRDDTASWATRIQQWMAAGHGAEDWHLELRSVPESSGPGTGGRMAGLDAVVALIGPRWLDGGGPDERVAAELAAAMRAGVDVVPVLVDGAGMPQDEELPPELRNLVAYPALHMGGATFEHDLGRLAERVAPEPEPATPASTQGSRARLIVLIAAALLVLIGAVVALAIGGTAETGSLGLLLTG